MLIFITVSSYLYPGVSRILQAAIFQIFFLFYLFVYTIFMENSYFSSKIHKEFSKLLGHLAISNNRKDTKKVSEFLDHHLQPGTKERRAHIKDTFILIYFQYFYILGVYVRNIYNYIQILLSRRALRLRI